MKLKELFEPKITKHKTGTDASEKINKSIGKDKYGEYTSANPKNKLVSVIGSGAYASAIEHDHHPSEVIKISNKIADLDNDGYFKFVSAITKNNRLQNNPYLPKIYKIKIYTTEPSIKENTGYFYVIHMEKLFSLHDLGNKEIEMLTDKMFFTVSSKIDKEHGDSSSKRAIFVQTIDDAIKNISNHNAGTVNIKDPLLKQAILIIKKILKNRNFGNDIHGRNIMIRRTSVGPQLVITDPLSSA